MSSKRKRPIDRRKIDREVHPPVAFRQSPQITPGARHTTRGRKGGFAAASPRMREISLDDPTNPEIILISSVVQTGDHQTPHEFGITSDHFHSHRQEWDWIERFALKYRKAPDKSTFRGQFPDFPLLKTTDVGYGVEAVEKAHLRYSLTSALKETTNYLVEDDPLEAMRFLHSSLTGIDQNGTGREAYADALRDYNPFLEEAVRRIEASQTMGYSGVSYGFPTLNDRTGGLHPGDLVIWAARLGQGKTWMLCKVASEAILTGKRVVFVSLEQPRSQIVFRIHTLLAKELGYSLRHRDLMQGVNMDVDVYRSFLAGLPESVPDSSSLFVSDPTRGRATPYTLAALLERHDPDLLILDYLTLMKTESDDWQGVARLSKETKLVGTQYGVPILAAAQINREGDAGRRPPSAKHLAQGDSIGQDADVVVTMKKDSESVLQCLLAKNRSGQDGQIFYSSFKPNEGDIREITSEEATTLVALDIEEDD